MTMTNPGSALRLQEARRLDAEGRVPQALLAYRMLLRLDPACLEGKVDFAGLLSVVDRHAEAEQLCREVLAVEPGNPSALLNLAGALWGQERFQEAAGDYERVLKVQPTLLAAHLGLGMTLARLGRLQEARAALEKVLALDPAHVLGRQVLVQILLRLKDWGAAQAAWVALVGQQYPPAEATYETAHILLTFGAFQQGLELMESRLEPSLARGRVIPVYPQPRWDGAPFPGKTLLLFWEQGFGDTVMFIRYAALAKARGGRVLVRVQQALVPLVRTLAGVDGVYGSEEPLPDFDLQLPLGSLPMVFGTRLESIPAGLPYLHGPVQAVPALEAALAGAAPGLRVGLVWAGNPGHTRDAQRSIPPALLGALGQVPGVTWFSLQVGQDVQLPFENIRDLGPLLTDFGATAWVLERLDLVLTVDTAIAHLAGALGRPTWLLVSFIPDWRWLLEREDSPWYPGMRLFRQGEPKDWPEVLGRVGRDLEALVRGGGRP
jgi:tetratricopeptide (TPR) repeat protein